MLTSCNRLTRPLVVAAVVAAALAGSSCGDDEPSADKRDQAAKAADATDSTAASTPQTLAPESPSPVTSGIQRLRRAFLADDIPGLCESMTAGAKVAAGKAVHGEPTTCVRDVRKLFRTIEKGNGWEHEGEPRVTGLALDGREAIALMSLGQQLAEIPMAKVDGRWKLDGFFGNPQEDVDSFVRNVQRRRFPPARPENALGDTTVKVRDAAGSPCPKLTDEQFPQVAGGCEVHAASNAPLQLSVLTPFGDFKFEKCRISYRILADRAGRTWTDSFDAAGPDTSACGDVNACFDKDSALLPWKGRLRSDGEGGFYHRMNMCLATCVGPFVGDLAMRMYPEGRGWRVEPMEGGGQTGFHFDGRLSINAKGVDLEGAQAPSL